MGNTDNGALSVPADLLSQVTRAGHSDAIEHALGREEERAEANRQEVAEEPAVAEDAATSCPHCSAPVSDLERKFGNCMGCGKPLNVHSCTSAAPPLEVRI